MIDWNIKFWKQHKMRIFTSIMALLVIAMLLLQGCSSSSNDPDVQFARTAFTSLAKGESSVEAFLDWTVLRVVGMDVGAQYTALPNETEKAGFRQSFVSSFSSSFQAEGANADNLTNWRMHDASTKTVAASANSKTILITISGSGGTRKISDLEMVSG